MTGTPKTRVVYLRERPAPDEWIAIQTEGNPPYVWCRYHPTQTIPQLPSDMLIVRMTQAERLFDLQQAENP